MSDDPPYDDWTLAIQLAIEAVADGGLVVIPQQQSEGSEG